MKQVIAIVSMLTGLLIPGVGWTQSACTLKIPMPPDPIPINFDYTPLAKNWCSQLNSCGYALPNCVNVYLDTISLRFIPAKSTPPKDAESSFTLQCEHSEEYQTNPAICGEYPDETGTDVPLKEGLLLLSEPTLVSDQPIKSQPLVQPDVISTVPIVPVSPELSPEASATETQ